MDFKFTSEYKASQLDEIVDYILGTRLWIAQADHPDITGWAKKAHFKLRKETKRALVCFSASTLVGVAIYQKHKSVSDYVELKNISVRPEPRSRYIASFLIRNVEVEASREFGSNLITCDAKERNYEITHFLKNTVTE